MYRADRKCLVRFISNDVLSTKAPKPADFVVRSLWNNTHVSAVVNTSSWFYAEIVAVFQTRAEDKVAEVLENSDKEAQVPLVFGQYGDQAALQL